MFLRLVTPVLAVVVLSGCTVSLTGPSAPAPSGAPGGTVSSPATGPSSAASAPASTGTPPAASTAPQTRTWTHDLVSAATRRADGGTATVKGGRIFEHATSLWAGCDGGTDEVTLTLGGKYRKLAGELALREEVPAGIIIHTLILVDGQPVQNVQLDAGDTATVAVNAVVTGARTATFQSKVVSGTCGPSERSYAVLGDGYVDTCVTASPDTTLADASASIALPDPANCTYARRSARERTIRNVRSPNDRKADTNSLSNASHVTL